VAKEQTTLLVVEDDVDVADMLNAYFRVQGYGVLTAYWGEEAVRICRSSRPDLVILDIRLPDIDGYEVARRLRSNRRTSDIPIIFLTEKRDRSDRLHGFELGADDYITKPFDIQELRLRVRNALRRVTEGPLTNPITGLAEGPLVDERLTECLGNKDWAILLVSLEHLDVFREEYGFVASDDVQRAVSLMISNAVRDVSSPSDFIGQLSPTQFVLVTVPANLPGLSGRISSRLEQALDYFYPLKDREQNNFQHNRLSVHLHKLLGSQGPFNNLPHLKEELLKATN
jgi:PleD family two-component response regulator